MEKHSRFLTILPIRGIRSFPSDSLWVQRMTGHTTTNLNLQLEQAKSELNTYFPRKRQAGELQEEAGDTSHLRRQRTAILFLEHDSRQTEGWQGFSRGEHSHGCLGAGASPQQSLLKKAELRQLQHRVGETQDRT